MSELIKVTYEDDKPVVSARELHEFLEAETEFRHWFPRMCEYGFIKGVDFNPVKIDRVQQEGTRIVTRAVDDAALTIDMAKELCMLQRSDKGKLARQYFIQLEKDWNSPEKVMARALEIAHRTIHDLKADNLALMEENVAMQPKADYFDELVNRNTLTGIRETAKELGVSQKKFVQFLIDNKFLYRSPTGKLLPYEAKNDGLFALKEAYSESNKWSGTQTLVTPKGRDRLRKMIAEMTE